jgi:hypothetical protein
MAGLHEVSGIELIERISQESLQKRSIRDRVWSAELGCWGFFSSDPSDLDKIIIIGCSKPGDVFLPDGSIIWKPVSKGTWEPYKAISPGTLGVGTVFSKDCDSFDGNSIIKMSFLLSGANIGIFEIFAQQTIAYKTLWKLAM